MTDEQINQRIAEACGWKGNVLDRDMEGNLWPSYTPLYCSDLNAMHEAEKVLTKDQVREYQCFMYDMACESHTTHGRWMPYSATARYRAEAVLRALGKWEGVQG